MKKRALSLVIVAAILCSVFPLIASAETTGDPKGTIVNFTIEEREDPAPSDSGPLTGTYHVDIPSSIGLNYEHDIVFTTRENNIADNERLVVSIDADRTFEYPDGLFYLYYKEGPTTYDRIECVLKRGSSSDFSKPPSEVLNGLGDTVVATFKNDSSGADTYGWLAFEPIFTPENVAGSYTGTVYFEFDVVSE